MRQSRRQLHMPEDLPAGRVHGLQQGDGVRVRPLESVQQADRDREKCGDHHQGDLGLHAEAHPQHQQRRDGHRRNCLGDHQQWKPRLFQQLKPVHGACQRKCQQRSDSQPVRRLRQEDARMAEQDREVPHKGAENVCRGGQHIIGNQPGCSQSPPHQHQQAQCPGRQQLISDTFRFSDQWRGPHLPVYRPP